MKSLNHLNNYLIVKKIGSGAFGEVYQVKCDDENEDHRVYALKCIRLGMADRGMPQNPFREMKAMQELNHKNVVRLFDVVAHGTELGLVMEYMAADLAEILDQSNGPIPLVIVKTCMIMLLQGVAYCHRQSIMHRDLKPSNLLISKDGQLKIADFGLARVFSDRNKDYSHQAATRWYRAPELLFGSRSYTSSVDIWAIGCIFAELLRHRPLFPGENDIHQISKVVSLMGHPASNWPGVADLPDYSKVVLPECKPIPMKDLATGAPADAIDLLSNMLCYNPNDRITAEEALGHDFFFQFPLPLEILPPSFAQTSPTLDFGVDKMSILFSKPVDCPSIPCPEINS